MTRITITLPEEVAVSLTREARRQGTSVSELIRRVLARRKPSSKLPIRALGRSGTRHTARDADAVLAEGFGDHRHR